MEKNEIDKPSYDAGYMAGYRDANVEDHGPAIAPHNGGTSWGVYCAACSYLADDYIYPCKLGRWPLGGFMPPESLVAK